MRHLRQITTAPAPARSILVLQAELEILNSVLDVIERVLDLIKGSSNAE